MKKFIFQFVRNIPWYLLGYMFILSLVLAFHNIPLYHYKHGLDGGGHVDYLLYIVQNGELPPASHGWETHQSPLYYLFGSFLMSIFGTWKAAQYINIVVLWALIGVSYLGLRKVFKKKDQAIMGVLALAALPMLNIFPVMITNELMNTLWSIATLVSALYLLKVKDMRNYILYSVLVSVFFIIGFWTKVSIIMIAPIVAGVYVYKLLKGHVARPKQLIIGVVMAIVISAACFPVYFRATQSVGPSNLGMVATKKMEKLRPVDFYFRLDWIAKTDMYNTQYYSMLGGAWNSFFSDGHNVLTPFVPFHKKAFVLWTIGFILFPVSLYGLYRLYKKDKVYGVFATSIGVLMFAVYVYYNSRSLHYSSARLTYEMPIVLSYAFGIAGASSVKWLKYALYFILFVQFTVMVSFFWIEPWWHVTEGY